MSVDRKKRFKMPSIFYSTIVNAPLDVVWNEIRDFGALDAWHPLIVACEIEDQEASDKVGCVRKFTLEDGALFREKLLAMNDFKKTFSYSIEESPLPITNYVATMKFTTVTEGNLTFASWSSTFDCPADSEGELTELVENGVYKSGLDSIKNRVEKQLS